MTTTASTRTPSRPRRGLRGLAAGVAAAAITAAAALSPAAPDAAARRGPTGEAGPEARDFATAYARSLAHPGMMPPDVNDWSCVPSPEHPRPVVLIHGTWDNAYATWSMLTPMLKEAGYCAYAFNYGDDESGLVGLPPGVYGTQTLTESGDEVAGFVDEVLERTGASQVDLVGHSQGGIQARLYVQDHGGANPADPSRNRVKNVVGLGANNHGTTFAGLAAMGGMLQDFGLPVMDAARLPLGDGGVDQGIGSPFFEELNRDGETRRGIDYTMIATRYDWNVAPYRGQFLEEEPGSSVNNITLQDGCASDKSEHLSMTFSPRVLDLVMEALDDGDYRSAHPDVCVPVAPFTGALPGAGPAPDSA